MDVKKQDLLTVIGLVTAIALMILGMLGGSSLMVFYDPFSIAITVGGSVGALLISYPMKEIKRLGKVIVETFKEETTSKVDTITLFTNLSRKARREGLLSLEDDIANIEDEFTRKALNMVVDGIEPEAIKEIMQLEIVELEKRHEDGSAMLKSLGAYGPAFGMLGTLIGLIQMLADMNDAANLTKGMGKALITTFYGSILANIIAIPMAQKLDYKTAQEVNGTELTIEGVIAIQSGVNPRIVEDKLSAYLSPSERAEIKAMGVNNNEVAENV